MSEAGVHGFRVRGDAAPRNDGFPGRPAAQGGSHDDLWLYNRSGKLMGQVAQGTNASKRLSDLG